MEPVYDILGLGAVAIDDLVYVEDYPPPDVKMHVAGRDRQCGGLTATALVAASRLGSKCAYAGMLGEDALSRFVAETMEREGIDLRHLALSPEARPIHSTIIVGQSRKTRNIFASVDILTGAHPELPPAEVIRSARVLFADSLGMEGMIRAARIAREAAIPVVIDIENDRSPLFPDLIPLVDHLIIPQDFAFRLTGLKDAARAVSSLWMRDPKTVVVTCGEAGSWYTSDPRTGAIAHQPAFQVEVADTTGCGDVFHGAYASALARGLPIQERLRFASAAAALKATRQGGQAGIPNRATVEDFLKTHIKETLHA
ncbi:MAG: hypothetical protein IT210_20410 [Armatimonadetes bacterium]|nr:hypothetical protein [Armatimonadota bacterium]